jgi:hypothetical protein
MIRAYAQRLLQSPEQLPRWEKRAPFYETGASSLELRVRFRPSPAWDLAEALGPCIDAPYTRLHTEEGALWVMKGRRILLYPASLYVQASGRRGDEAPGDHGIQDALLGAVVSLLSESFRELEFARSFDTPFPQAPPEAERGPEAWKKLLQLTTPGLDLEGGRSHRPPPPSPTPAPAEEDEELEDEPGPTSRSLQRHYKRLLRAPEKLGRWDLALPFRPMAVGSSEDLEIHLRAPQIGKYWSILSAFEALIGAPYVRTPFSEEDAALFRTQGRLILLRPRVLQVRISGAGGEGPPWDGGIQDALLRTIVEQLGSRLFDKLVHEHSDEHDDSAPRIHPGGEGWARLGELIAR